MAGRIRQTQSRCGYMYPRHCCVREDYFQIFSSSAQFTATSSFEISTAGGDGFSGKCPDNPPSPQLAPLLPRCYSPVRPLSPPPCSALLSVVSSAAQTTPTGKSSGLDLGQLPPQTPPLLDIFKVLMSLSLY